MIQYTKLRSGAWGLRSDSPVTPGQAVTVTKRDGSTKSEVVKSIVWTGDGVWLAAIATSKDQADAPARPRSRRFAGRRGCPQCGNRSCPKAWSAGDLCQDD